MIDQKNEPSSSALPSSQPQPDIVTLDEDPLEAEPVIAVSVEAVPVPTTTTTAANNNHNHDNPYAPNQTSTTTPLNNYSDNNKPYGRHHDNNEYDDGANGFDCMLCGDTKIRRLRSGGLMMNCFMSLCGNSFFDLRESISSSTTTAAAAAATNPMIHQPQPLVYNITMLRLCGDIRILVPPGTIVRVRRLMLCGNRDIQIEPAQSQQQQGMEEQFAGPRPPPAAKVIVNILMLCGNLIVRSDDRDL